jgi:hypothetical protein
VTVTIFQRIVTGRMVEAAVRDHCQRWSPDYVAEVSEQSGRDRCDLPTFRSYLPALDLDKFEEDQVPACVIVAPGTMRPPAKRGHLWYVTWQLSIGCVVSGQDRDNTFELVPLYAAAVRALMVQHPSLGVDWVDGVSWLGERYDELDTDDSRTIAAASVTFAIDVPSAVDSRGGPAAPSADPCEAPGEWGTVQDHGTTTESRDGT